MQQKNFIAFMIVSALILGVWMWLQPKLFPPPVRKENASADKKEEEKKKPAVADTKQWVKFSTAEKQALLIAQAVSTPALIPILAREHPEQFLAKATVKPAIPEKPPETFTLGGSDSFLTVKLTDRGAGVQQVTLNKFEGAGRLGLPAGDKLHLVPEDPFRPSYLLYHYENPDAAAESVYRPVDTLGRMTWKTEGKVETDANGVQTLRFSVQVPPPYSHLTITKTYTLDPRAYHIGLKLEIKNNGGKDKSDFRYQLAGAHGLPIEGEWYTGTFRNSIAITVQNRSSFPHIQDARSVSFEEGGNKVPEASNPEVFLQSTGIYNQYFAAMIVVDNEQFDPVKQETVLDYARPTLEATEEKGVLTKISADTTRITVHLVSHPRPKVQHEVLRTFTLLPSARDDLERVKENEPVVVRYYDDGRGEYVASHVREGREPHSFSDDITVRAVSSPIKKLEPGSSVIHQYLLYHGPTKVKLLGHMGKDSPDQALLDRYMDKLNLFRLTDFGKFGWWTELIIACTNIMHWLLNLLHAVLSVLPNFLSYGLSIILLTVVVRGAMFPISRKQAYLSLRMQELAPELKKVQEKYKNDPPGRNQAVMELYRKHNVHPLGGCLPLLLQMPVFMGLYYALQESVHFRLQPFLWIRNLAAPDMTVWWGEHIPYISTPDSQGGWIYLGPYLNILPIFAVALMLVQQKMLTPPPTDEQQEMNQKMMKYMMVVMGIMFYKVAAGLCLYFIASSLWGVAERKLLPKKKLPPGTQAAAGAKPPLAPPPRKGRNAKKEIKKPDGTVQKVKDWWADILEQARKR